MKLSNINDLREVLCDEIVRLRAKETTAANVNAVTNATGKILSTVKIEIEYAKLLGRQPSIGMIQLTDQPAAPQPK